MDPVTVLAAPQKVSFMRRTIIRCEPASKPLRDPLSEPPCVSMRLNQAGEVFTTACLRMAAQKAASYCERFHPVRGLGRVRARRVDCGGDPSAMTEILISSDPKVMMGKPVIAGTRITV